MGLIKLQNYRFVQVVPQRTSGAGGDDGDMSHSMIIFGLEVWFWADSFENLTGRCVLVYVCNGGGAKGSTWYYLVPNKLVEYLCVLAIRRAMLRVMTGWRPLERGQVVPLWWGLDGICRGMRLGPEYYGNTTPCVYSKSCHCNATIQIFIIQK